jgi:hypothetical protein
MRHGGTKKAGRIGKKGKGNRRKAGIELFYNKHKLKTDNKE